jgi:hypothetical protein
VKGDHVTLVRNDDYWDGAPYLDAIVIKPVPEEPTRVMQLGMKIRRWRLFGASALELCYVGSGRIDGFIDLRGTLRVTDAAAGLKFGARLSDRKRLSLPYGTHTTYESYIGPNCQRSRHFCAAANHFLMPVSGARFEFVFHREVACVAHSCPSGR